MHRGISRIALGAGLALVAALGVSLANGVGARTSFENALILALVVGAIVAVFHWAMAIARRKGYSPWVGFWVVVVLNVIGVVLLLGLPVRSKGKA